MFPKLTTPIYDMDLTEKSKYQKDLLYLDLQGSKIKRPPQPYFNQIVTEKKNEDQSIFRLKNDRFYNSSVPVLPPLYIITPPKRDLKDRTYIKAQFVQNQFSNFKKIFQK